MRSPALAALASLERQQQPQNRPQSSRRRVRRNGPPSLWSRIFVEPTRPRRSIQPTKKQQSRVTQSSLVRMAAEEKLPQISQPRKRLPRLREPERTPYRFSAIAEAPAIELSGSNASGRALPVFEEQQPRDQGEQEIPQSRKAGAIDPWLLIVTLVLICIGIVMIYSSSAFTAAREYNNSAYFFQHELLFMSLGLIAMLFTMRIDYRFWRRLSLPAMVIILPLLVIVLRFGTVTYGASRWLSLGSFFSFQPSELTKLVLALYIADWLARKGRQVGTFLYGLAPFVILVGIVLGLVLLENDMGTAIIIAASATAMFFTAGANIVQFLLAMGCGILIFAKEAFKGYRYYRIAGFLDPFKDITGINLQLYQSLLALGSGGWLGLGLGASRQKTGYLPFPFTDSIFPIMGEELGFLGCALVVLLFMILAFRGFRLARRTTDLYGSLLATGITTWLIVQAMVNIGANTATIPYTGVPLPFISYGGSSVVISLAAVGVLLNISRYLQKPEVPALSRQTIQLKKRNKRPS